MMMRHSVLSAVIVGCGLAFTQPAAAQDRALTARDLVELAKVRNRELLAARERVAEAQGLLRQAGVRQSPTVEIEAGTGGPLRTRGEEEYSASYFHPIETAGKRGKRLGVAEKGVARARAEFADRIRQAAFEVKMRVADALAAQQKSEALVRLMAAGQDQYRLTKARVEEGDAAALDEQLLLTELNRTRAQQISSLARFRSLLIDVRRAVGLPMSEPLSLAAPAATMSELRLDELMGRALRERPDVQAAQVLEDGAAADLALTRAEGVPDLTASGKYTHRNSQFEHLFGFNSIGALNSLRDRDNVLTFGLSVPLFAPGRNRGNVEAAAARSTSAQLHRQALEAAVPQEVEAAYHRWLAAKEAVALFQHGIVDKSAKNLAVMRQAYTLGQLRLIDVLTEQRRSVESELAYIDAQMELAQATAELERALGSDIR